VKEENYSYLKVPRCGILRSGTLQLWDKIEVKTFSFSDLMWFESSLTESGRVRCSYTHRCEFPLQQLGMFVLRLFSFKALKVFRLLQDDSNLIIVVYIQLCLLWASAMLKPVSVPISLVSRLLKCWQQAAETSRLLSASFPFSWLMLADWNWIQFATLTLHFQFSMPKYIYNDFPGIVLTEAGINGFGKYPSDKV